MRATEVLAGATVVLAGAAEVGAVAGAGLVPPTAAITVPAGPPATWPTEGEVVRLYPGDGLAASAADRAALDAVGRAYGLLPGVPGQLAVAAAAASRARAVLPLEHRTVVVTRPADQAAPMVAALRRLGARVVPFPTIEVGPPADGGAALTAAVATIDRYDWLIVTSANGARAVLAVLADARRAAGVGIAAIGPATAAVLAAGHLPADLVPGAYVAEALLHAFPPPPSGSGRGRVLIARAAVARDVLPDGLARAGWRVDVVEAYRTVGVDPPPALVDAAAAADVVTFTSPSTVERFLAVVGPDRAPAIVACIGPVTAAAARAAGLEVAVEAPTFTVEGLVDALVAWHTRPGRRGPGR